MNHAILATFALAGALAAAGTGCELVAGIQDRSVAGEGTGGEAIGPGASGGRSGSGGVTGTGGARPTTGSGGRGVVVSGTGGQGVGTGGVSGSGGAATGGVQACVKPNRPLITDFSDPLDADTFGDADGVIGVAFHLGAGLTHTTTGGAFRTSGTLTDAVGGMGIALPCVDASMYSGISFTISGSVAGGGATTLTILNRSNEPAPPTGMGQCRYTSEATAFVDCVQPSKTIPIPSAPTTVRLAWSELTGGKPVPNVDPKQLSSLVWLVPYMATPSPRAVDVTIDDLRFW